MIGKQGTFGCILGAYHRVTHARVRLQERRNLLDVQVCCSWIDTSSRYVWSFLDGVLYLTLYQPSSSPNTELVSEHVPLPKLILILF